MKLLSTGIVALVASSAAVSALKMSPEGLDMLKGFEGFRNHYYRDSAGNWTIGYGHNCDKSKCANIHEPLFEPDARNILAGDVGGAEHCVNTNTPNLKQHQFDALVSFTYNLGCHGYTGSKLMEFVKNKNWKAAAGDFVHYDHSGGKEVPGLKTRRLKESAHFCSMGGC
ncbi:lysozyme-like protein [Ramicandelaber brevisporus]|nr:lysozyme-like protein [Ramicandelaber brevisporus]